MSGRWLLVCGRVDRPLDAHVLTDDEIRAHSSSKRPSVQPGDGAILYAAVWQVVFAVAEVTGEPENDRSLTRWAWRFPIHPVAVVDDLERAPPVEAAGIFPHSVWRHSHIRLVPEQFDAARELIVAAARD
ncbi:MAG: hypothetical protein ABR583_05795 [Gaiellaceae bacterium]